MSESQQFVKQGRIVEHFAQCPVVDKLGDRWRIYYAFRDSDNRSHTTFIEVEAVNPKNVLYRHEKEILPLGQVGTYDEHGVMPTCIITVGKLKYLYYVGWARKTEVPYENSTCLAIGDGVNFEKMGPVLQKGEGDLFTGTCWIDREIGIYQAVYLSGDGWLNNDPTYSLRIAHSEDGYNWMKGNKHKLKRRTSICSYTQIKKISLWAMRDNLKRNYIIDGTHQILPSEGWDSEMTCYPYLVEHEGKVFCFYNGNGFGATGIGYAIL